MIFIKHYFSPMLKKIRVELLSASIVMSFVIYKKGEANFPDIDRKISHSLPQVNE